MVRVAQQWRMLPFANRTALMAAQLLCDVLLDKSNTGHCISLNDMLSYQEVMKLAGIPSTCGANKILREIIVLGRRVTRSDLWTIEHYLRAGLEQAKSEGLSDSHASIELLRLFWEEKAETGEVLSIPEVDYVQFLLGRLDIIPDDEATPAAVPGHEVEEQACPMFTQPVKPNQRAKRLPAKQPQRDAILKQRKDPRSALDRVKSLFRSLWPGETVRTSPRRQKQPWATQKLMTRIFEYMY